MIDSRELEDLTNLVTHPGWLRFKAAMDKQWSEQISQRLESAVSDTDDAMAANKMRQVIAAKKAIDAALRWPEDRVATIQRREIATVGAPVRDVNGHPIVLSRGGY